MRLLALLLAFAPLSGALGLPDVALAQLEDPQPIYDAHGVLEAPPAPLPEAVGGLMFGPRAVYLGSLDHAGGDFGGVEMVFGGWVGLEGPLSMVLRARVASYVTIASPALELDDTSCSPGAFYWTLCGHDLDMLALGVGGELGLRLQHLEGTRDFSVAWGGELVASGTGYLDTFEHVGQSGGLGAMLLVSTEIVVRERWGVGLDLGARVEAGLVGSPTRAGAHATLRFVCRL